ncbi:hypothetical protein SDC9_209785 [bioreactor metagenome]|uniref:Uncharacterized protein n=1 Tax=bioreactor metagenome TaxID=1076179 RepID=A0A645JH74_9ZZZZ
MVSTIIVVFIINPPFKFGNGVYSALLWARDTRLGSEHGKEPLQKWINVIPGLPSLHKKKRRGQIVHSAITDFSSIIYTYLACQEKSENIRHHAI